MRCIVMELVEGETLQAQIRRGPIPVNDALAIARRILEALESAHEKGIVHRDLKPGNVMLTGSRAFPPSPTAGKFPTAAVFSLSGVETAVNFSI